MPYFSERSTRQLMTCCQSLQDLFNTVVLEFDCTVIEGHRSKERQERMVREGKSKLSWPASKHNTTPSQAVDVVPYPIDWLDLERMIYFAGYVKGRAESKGIAIRWGGDWDRDNELSDERFKDFPHFEIDG